MGFARVSGTRPRRSSLQPAISATCAMRASERASGQDTKRVHHEVLAENGKSLFDRISAPTNQSASYIWAKFVQLTSTATSRSTFKNSLTIPADHSPPPTPLSSSSWLNPCLRSLPLRRLLTGFNCSSTAHYSQQPRWWQRHARSRNFRRCPPSSCCTIPRYLPSPTRKKIRIPTTTTRTTTGGRDRLARLFHVAAATR